MRSILMLALFGFVLLSTTATAEETEQTDDIDIAEENYDELKDAEEYKDDLDYKEDEDYKDDLDDKDDVNEEDDKLDEDDKDGLDYAQDEYDADSFYPEETQKSEPSE
ncbi:PREDICTED: probable DNA-directed RNA polymerase subunit delta [Drosophila arizonae]|uniref:Probable DNA-directed RNA polymerase subunit delta n=1 Tax=Drosophila arizonae TaxID=7263 RepID=A0ABM1P0T0_DROAR|nr:PREDICTED: probable DNA-directed RNA polymerase subunit delta [Drosophila arizonae]